MVAMYEVVDCSDTLYKFGSKKFEAIPEWEYRKAKH